MVRVFCISLVFSNILIICSLSSFYSFPCLILLQENSLKEWSYNFAITAETYDGYDPIPVPFNIIYSIAKLLKLVKKKENKEKKRRQVLLSIYRNGGSSWVKITNLVNTLNVPWCSQVVLPFSVALGNWEYFYFSLYWMIHVVHGRVTPATKFAVTVLLGGERH